MHFTTRKTLLERVGQGDEISYVEFYQFYKPFIISQGKRRGLTHTESEELLQDIMTDFFANSKTFIYDHNKGHFRGYLYRIIRNRGINIIKKRPEPTWELQEYDEIFPDEKPDSDFMQDWRLLLFRQACDIMKERIETVTYEAFYLYAIQKRKATEVAAYLQTTVNSVYVAKNRCVKMLQDIIREIEKKEGDAIV